MSAAVFASFRIPLGWWLLWLILAAVTAGLIVLLRSRWGRSRPLRKYVILSLLAHLLLVAVATTIRIVTTVQGGPEPTTTRVTILLDQPRSETAAAAESFEPWETIAHDRPAAEAFDVTFGDRFEPAAAAAGSLEPIIELLARQAGPGALDPAPADPLPPVPTSPPAPAADPPVPPIPTDRPAAAADRATDSVHAGSPLAAATDRASDPPSQPPSDRQQATSARPAGDADVPEVGAPAGTPEPVARSGRQRPIVPVPAATGDVPADAEPQDAEPHHAGDAARTASSAIASDVPAAYRNRFAADRLAVATASGGDSKTEAAVEAALAWLAANQAADGRWDADRHGAGREQIVSGHDRQGAGFRADTGITGLALLAMLGAGHTHLAGPYRAEVARGLGFLRRSQKGDGSLGGEASLYAHTYCHAMATFALSEAYATTHDAALDLPVRRAVAYSIAAQNRSGGGWRYRPGDPGDTSQMGWQVMALKSAELAGVPIPEETREAMRRFLRSVAAGRHGGLASYQPRSRVTPAMTAEALACRQLLDPFRDRPAEREAADYLLAHLPGSGETNLYYWYYATLSLYQVQGEAWRRWNDALKRTLVAAQRTDGPLAGSWDPQTVWGGYGGRVYATALAALSLEVYYRYLPLYLETARLNRWRR